MKCQFKNCEGSALKGLRCCLAVKHTILDTCEILTCNKKTATGYTYFCHFHDGLTLSLRTNNIVKIGNIMYVVYDNISKSY